MKPGQPKGVTTKMREALRVIERDPERGYLAIHSNTLRHLEQFELAHPARETCSHCGTQLDKGWRLTAKGRAQVRNLGLVVGGE
jgi:hypothetical protein